MNVKRAYEEENKEQETTRLSLAQQVARGEAEAQAKERRRRNSERLSASYAAEKRYKLMVEKEMKLRNSQNNLKGVRSHSHNPALSKEQIKIKENRKEMAERARVLAMMSEAY